MKCRFYLRKELFAKLSTVNSSGVNTIFNVGK